MKGLFKEVAVGQEGDGDFQHGIVNCVQVYLRKEGHIRRVETSKIVYFMTIRQQGLLSNENIVIRLTMDYGLDENILRV